jgi:nicotinate phosphoribosyltransferase
MSGSATSLDLQKSVLVTDLYELTMVAGYFEKGFNPPATFELFIRSMPDNRGYMVFAGLAQALEYLEQLRFTSREISYLKKLPVFKHISRDFFDYLKSFRFTGEVWAPLEGELCFAGEPLLRVTAPLIEAQLVETYLLTVTNFQTLIATKAARVVDAADGRGVVDFGTRRAHGPEASILAARACYIGGCTGTSNVYAAMKLGIRPVGTMAHSFVMAFDTEDESFEAFRSCFPENAILLIDTFDTAAGARKAAKIQEPIQGVRLDSGDLVKLSKQVRQILDRAGKHDIQIVASSDLNEYVIDRMLKQDAPFDLFGVGTEMVTSKDVPALGGVYKLVEIEKRGKTIPKIKLSSEKATYPGKKQVFRELGATGFYKRDVVASADEKIPGRPILKKVMAKGKVKIKPESLDVIRKRALAERGKLTESVRRIENPRAYPVQYSARLKQDLDKTRRRIRAGEREK